MIIGKPLIRFERIDSTNKYAIELLSKSNPSEGTAIYALDQFDGRGQIGRKWQSEDGQNVSVSIILYPKFLLASDQFSLNMLISLAVKETIEHFIEQKATIKWPNDIYVKDRKIAGILIQNLLSGKYLKSSVLGIGINVNQSQFDPLIPNPTSLITETQKSFNILDVMAILFENLNKYYKPLLDGQMDSLFHEYHMSLYRRNVKSQFRDESGNPFEGTILRINSNGAIVIEVGNEMRVFNFRELSFVI